MKDGDNTRISYLEAVFVTVILGAVAVTVVPRFTQASPEARICRLVERLQAMRCQIELYRIQHNGDLPGNGTATFEQAMTGKTNAAGTLGAAGRYGPYLKKIPRNPFNDLDAVEIEAGGADVGGGNFGWHFNSSTGAFCADTDVHTSL